MKIPVRAFSLHCLSIQLLVFPTSMYKRSWEGSQSNPQSNMIQHKETKKVSKVSSVSAAYLNYSPLDLGKTVPFLIVILSLPLKRIMMYYPPFSYPLTCKDFPLYSPSQSYRSLVHRLKTLIRRVWTRLARYYIRRTSSGAQSLVRASHRHYIHE